MTLDVLCVCFVLLLSVHFFTISKLLNKLQFHGTVVQLIEEMVPAIEMVTNDERLTTSFI